MTANRFPTDSPIDRARRVADSYRHLIDLVLTGQIDDLQAARDRLDTHWVEHGQSWILPTYAPLPEPDEFRSPAELADLFHIDPRRLRDWHRLGHVDRIKCGKRYHYRVGDVMAYGAQPRRRSAG